MRWGRLGLVLVFAACSTSPNLEGTNSPVPSPPETAADGNPAPDEETLAHYDFMVACLAELGIPAEYDPESGGLDIQSGESQSEALRSAIEQCRTEDGEPIGAPTEEYLRTYYQFLVMLHRCMTEISLPAPELITEDVFVDGGGLWHPYDLIWDEAEAAGTGTTSNLSSANTNCPNDPSAPRWNDG